MGNPPQTVCEVGPETTHAVGYGGLPQEPKDELAAATGNASRPNSALEQGLPDCVLKPIN
jgi:hypothetical protein